MPWGRLDDKANGNAKLLALSDSAWRMWGCGLIYCQNNLTDGFIPSFAIDAFGVRAKNKQAVADELCRSLVPGKGPLWHKVDSGYQVHDYLDWNDSRESVEKQRLAALQRKLLLENPGLRKQIRDRDGDDCRYCGRTVRWNDRKGQLGGTYDHVRPLGGNALDNVVVACRSCNSRKGGRTPEAAGMPLLSPRSKSRSGSRSEAALFDPDPPPDQDRDQGQDLAIHVPLPRPESTPAEERGSVPDPPERRSATPHPIRDLLTHYIEHYERIFAIRPRIDGAKDAAMLRDLLNQHNQDTVGAAMDVFFGDDYAKLQGFPLELFRKQFNRWLSKSAKPKPAGDWYGHIPHCPNKQVCTERFLREEREKDGTGGKAVSIS